MPTDTRIEDELSRAAVVSAALRTGLLKALAEGGGTAAELAAGLALDERACALVLEALTHVGFADVDGARYVASRELTGYLQATSLGPPSLRIWSHVEPFLRSGDPVFRSDGDPEERARLYRDAVSGLAQRWRESAEVLADHFDPPPREILDVGAGSGVWGLSLAGRRDDAHVTAIDLPDVLPQFDALASERGLSDRTRHLAGSWFDVELPAAAFDVAVLANVLHLETAPRASELLHRVAPAVKPGGHVVIVDAISDNTPERDRRIAMYALHLGMRSRHGTPHKRSVLESWLATAGLTDPTLLPLTKASALVARQPS